MPRIYADFNGIGPSPRDPSRLAVPLDTPGSARDLAAAGLRLREGCRITVYDWSDDDEDLEGDAAVFFDPAGGVWMAELDEKGYRYVPKHDRLEPAPFLCLACRAPLPRHASAAGHPVERCPRCGAPFAAAIAPPDAP